MQLVEIYFSPKSGQYRWGHLPIDWACFVKIPKKVWGANGPFEIAGVVFSEDSNGNMWASGGDTVAQVYMTPLDSTPHQYKKIFEHPAIGKLINAKNIANANAAHD